MDATSKRRSKTPLVFVQKVTQDIVRRSMSRTFRQSLFLILIAETVTIFIAWRLLDINTNRWILQKAAQAATLSQRVAEADWSRIEQIKEGIDSPLFQKYQQRLGDLNKRYFLRKEGSVYIIAVKNGLEDEIAANDPVPLNETGKANQWEVRAYSQGNMTYSPIPVIDENGTYLAAYTPIKKSGHVIGLVAVEYDEAPITDFQAIIRSAFWFSILPAILVSLAVANVLASMFVEPTDVLREIEETAQTQRDLSASEEENDPWRLLTAKEKEVADVLRQGREHTKDIAEAMSLAPSTVNTYLKRIKAKTGWSKQALAVQAAGRRSCSQTRIKFCEPETQVAPT